MMDFLLYLLAMFIYCCIQIVVHLKAKPEACAIAKVCAKAKSCISRDPPFLIYYLIDSARRYAKFSSEPILTYTKWLHEFLKKDFSGMKRSHILHSFPLVIVNDLYSEGIAVFPRKTDPPLIVDPNAVLPFPIAF